MHFHLDPLLVSECGPDVMGLSDSCFVRFQDHLGTVIVDVEGSEDQDESGKGLKTIETKHKLFTQGNNVMSPNINAHR